MLGSEHEVAQHSKYMKVTFVGYVDFEIFSECRYFISSDYPFLHRASPDALATCSCCNDGVCEIKVHLLITQLYQHRSWYLITLNIYRDDVMVLC